MINYVSIKNFALLKQTEIKFESGFNVIIGETGAGKSMVISAILFALGLKTDKSMIRTGEEFAKVQIVFSNLNDAIKSFTSENGYEIEDDELLITRTIYTDGKSECRINGQISTLTLLKQLSVLIIDCYQQHESTEILKVKNHITMLDNYNSALLEPVKLEIKKLLNEKKDITSQLKEIGINKEERERTIDLLNYQIKEIQEADLKDNEDEEISSQITLLANSEKYKNNMVNILQSIDGNSGILEQMNIAISSFKNLEMITDSFDDLSKRLLSAKYDIQDIKETISDKLNSVNYSDRELDTLELRQDKIKLLKKKYGSTINDIKVYLTNAIVKRDNILNSEKKIFELESNGLKISKLLYEEANKLTNLRKSMALEIENKIINELKDFGMKNAKFVINFTPTENYNDNFICQQNGNDNVEFLFSANSGEDIKSLSKTISGGEMSRFMLAIKNVLASKFGISTLILDEVDSGISGNIGSKVAEKIAKLSKTYQILCITHLPQVTAMADNYLFVSKQTINEKTYSSVEVLNHKSQVEYIAKLSSAGNQISESSIIHAEELKEWANQYKLSLNKL